MSKSSIVAASKQAERDVAAALGGRRLHAGEWQGEGDVDAVGPDFIAQVKQRKDVAGWLQEGVKQIEEALQSKDELKRLQPDIDDYPNPLVVIVTKPGSGRPSRRFVLMGVETYQGIHDKCNHRYRD